MVSSSTILSLLDFLLDDFLLLLFFFLTSLELEESELLEVLVTIYESSLSSLLESLNFFFCLLLVSIFRALTTKSSKDMVALQISALFSFWLLLPFRNQALKFLSEGCVFNCLVKSCSFLTYFLTLVFFVCLPRSHSILSSISHLYTSTKMPSLHYDRLVVSLVGNSSTISG